MTPTFERRRILLAGALLAGTAVLPTGAAAHRRDAKTSWPEPGELVETNERDVVIAAAKEMMIKAGHAALVTIDAAGMPRVRSVGTKDPEDDLTIWIATNPISRKVGQIRAHPEVALHWTDIDNMAAVSVMGIATIHDDLATKRAKNFYSEEQIKQFWPAFPDDFALISVRPTWLEIVAPHTTIKGDRSKWRPAGLDLET